MKNILYTLALLVCFNIYSQSKADYINQLVKIGKTQMIGTDIGGGMFLINVLNENDTSFVYVYNTSNEEVFKHYKSIISEQYFINQSPTKYSKLVKKQKIIAKWRFLYNNEMFAEVTVYPGEWND
tara:strand:+ start:94 stop:468 length:375 start_codon:yes stop_codon:yes gene_type:complete